MTNNKEKMTTKTTKTILFSALMLTVTLAVTETPVAWAHHADYLVPMTTVYQEIEVLQEEVNNIQEEINKISTTEQDELTVQKIMQLQQTLDNKIDKMQELAKEFQRLEQLNMDSYRVDPETKKKFYNAEDILYEQYINATSPTYVGDNPISFVTVDFQHKNLIVKFDPDQAAKKNLDVDKTPAKIVADIKLLLGEDIPVTVEYAKSELIACTSRTGVCDPIKGGVQVADVNNINGNGTSAWKSTDTSSNVGFVTARHVVGGFGNTVEQPVNNRDVGSVTHQCLLPTSGSAIGDTCDFAFVDLFNGIGISNTSIYRTSSASWVITNKVADTSQSEGTTIWKSGVGTGNTMGTITDNNPSNKYTVVELSVGSMDSGSPVFHQPSPLQNSVDLYGVLYKKAGTHALYHPWDYVKSTLGLTE